MSKPTRLADALSELITRRGYARSLANQGYQEAWTAAVGASLAKRCRVGSVRRGALEVTVANSALVQELTFQKAELISKLAQQIPQERITDIRLRVGPV